MKAKIKKVAKELNILVNASKKRSFTMEEEQKACDLIDQLEVYAHHIRDIWMMRHFHCEGKSTQNKSKITER